MHDTRRLDADLDCIETEPYYEPVGVEVALFEAAWASRVPVLLKGPTGCGKTRFVEHMAWRLARPLVTVSCHDDLTASDLVGRYLIVDNETVWLDGPLARAVRSGSICYLDEIVEARKDTTVVIHPLADSRRILPMEKRGELPRAPTVSSVRMKSASAQKTRFWLTPNTARGVLFKITDCVRMWFSSARKRRSARTVSRRRNIATLRIRGRTNPAVTSL